MTTTEVEGELKNRIIKASNVYNIEYAKALNNFETELLLINDQLEQLEGKVVADGIAQINITTGIPLLLRELYGDDATQILNEINKYYLKLKDEKLWLRKNTKQN